MIKIENVDVYGWEAAIRGMRNPKNSWDKSDSSFVDMEDWDCGHGIPDGAGWAYVVGKSDLNLMQTLANAGDDHGKFLRMITVTVDVTAPLYWWKEFDTYKVGTVANSCSTMHKIHDKEFTLDDFSHEHLMSSSRIVLDKVIEELNFYREQFLAEKSCKTLWWQLIQLLPSSYNQRRTVQLNYAVLKNMYHARRYHKLDEWRDFCDWIKTLSYSELITGEDN